jgi:hypothetical protein
MDLLRLLKNPNTYCQFASEVKYQIYIVNHKILTTWLLNFIFKKVRPAGGKTAPVTLY